MTKISRALVSVYDKSNIAELVRFLSENGVEILSTGGTARLLSKSGIKVTEVSDFTKSPEMMDGRVKTIHPKIHGGILADRSNKEHMKQAEIHAMKMIDLVIVNLYPFEQAVLGGKSHEEIIENIDIGGPTLLRSAAKNYKSVAVVTNPNRYRTIMDEISKSGKISDKTRQTLAIEAWEHVAHYDVVIEKYFRKTFGNVFDYPENMNLTFKKKQDLRYGENPHQTSAFYVDRHDGEPSITTAEQLQGKLLSYNNILDGNSALELIKEFDEDPTAVVVKHNNPSGVASHNEILEAYKLARSVDPEAAFGGVVCINREVDEILAQEISSKFVEMVIAPSFTDAAIKTFAKKKNVRLLKVEGITKKRKPYREYRSVVGGLLVQDGNVKLHDGTFNIVTKRKPTEEEMLAMKYAWKVCKYVKSNSIVYARSTRVVGIGAGQMKRVDAARLAAEIAADFGLDLKGCAMASDAFFPFRDGVDAAAKRGITTVIQPGGSIRDQEIIDACNENGMVMVFTGIRHFRH
ncbi:bifunctional phosphoribosylaminoimidazolecarboxamide formyltransferase/IMP cyclohydrolase [Candidatus Micrarchaeota archaeon]|nr:bifunctional phosphoribosylaminoimidazolecarboxamide formyltransferase/IMP cyclohydrolase [Candidatus Micrarchaeota archaeon]MBU1166539.1 bifunctional phosphoribosylaminoimidazolecarboxamide formyltransferase/IMP cyclohydrolase [Candidatus Micrarchaeota archaeon]MBU1887551.1 bifunctional phosphoribosylaminoimidazolecarboxamide formyltransferase/IMP cyclohydrolase [Candidatus Micrarchaeota archaeon]